MVEQGAASTVSPAEVRVEAAALQAFVAAVLARAGLPEDGAAQVADSLVEADLRGVHSHGVIRLGVYLRRLEAGLINPRPRIELRRVAPAALVVDGDHGMGAVVGDAAMAACLAAARESGVAAATVRRANHFGIAARYAMAALPHGMIGLASCNAAPRMAPTGGRDPLLGTNPFAIAIPAGQRPPLVVDMATAAAPLGKILLAQAKGEPIPPGWALDPEGRPTTDPAAALQGTLLPFGGYKGYALALVIDVLAGVLTGGLFGAAVRGLYEDFTRPQESSFFLAAIQVSAFLPWQEFQSRMEALVDAIKSSRPAPGVDEILLPGELEWRSRQAHLAAGIPLPPALWSELLEIGRRYGVVTPEPLTGPA